MDKDTKELLVLGSILLLIICLGYIGYATYIDTSLWLPWRAFTDTTCDKAGIVCNPYGYKDPIPTCIEDETCNESTCCITSNICSNVECPYGYIDKNMPCGDNFSCSNCCSNTLTCQTIDYKCKNGGTVTKPDINIANSYLGESNDGTDKSCGCKQSSDNDAPATCDDFDCGTNLEKIQNPATIQCDDGGCTFDTCCQSISGKCGGTDETHDTFDKCGQYRTDEKCNNQNNCKWCEDIKLNDQSCTTCDWYFSTDSGECKDETHPTPLDNQGVFCKDICTMTDCCGTHYCQSSKELQKISDKSSCTSHTSSYEGADSCKNLYVTNNSKDKTSGEVKTCVDPTSGSRCKTGHSCNLCPEGEFSRDGITCSATG